MEDKLKDLEDKYNQLVAQQTTKANELNAYVVSYIIKDIIADVVKITRPRGMPKSMQKEIDEYNYRHHLKAIMTLLDNSSGDKPKCPKCKGTGKTSCLVRDIGDGLVDRPYDCSYCNGTGDLY